MTALLIYLSIGEVLTLLCLALSENVKTALRDRGLLVTVVACVLLTCFYPLFLLSTFGWKGARS